MEYHPLTLCHGMSGWWTVWGGAGGDGGGCEVEEGGGRGCSRPLDSRGDPM